MKFDLEERLINFAVLTLNIAESLPELKGSIHLAGQLTRSGTAPALQYGEAQAAESRKDFIHKMKVALKELRETLICLKILERKNYLKSTDLLVKALSENNELISIFVKSVNTVIRNQRVEGN
jgi:four helix bundle protein